MNDSDKTATRTPKQEYIANCIDRIFAAPLHITQHRQRSRDLAEAVYVRAAGGEDAAHKFLVWLCERAEAGRYAEAIKPDF